MAQTHLTGGCQCGAVRYAWTTPPAHSSVCYCRMCQKASGQPMMGFTGGKREHLTWTRGQPSIFQSSNLAQRGFCKDCGTPLTFEWSADVIDLAICAFDDPAPIAPRAQLAKSSALPWVDALADLPDIVQGNAAAQAHYASIVSYQHPDHDTESWPNG